MGGPCWTGAGKDSVWRDLRLGGSGEMDICDVNVLILTQGFYWRWEWSRVAIPLGLEGVTAVGEGSRWCMSDGGGVSSVGRVSGICGCLLPVKDNRWVEVGQGCVAETESG